MPKFGKKNEKNYGDYDSCVMAKNKKDAFFSWHLIVCTDESTEKIHIGWGLGHDTEEVYKHFEQTRKLRRLRPNN
ncbi:Hypothetical protein PACV_64 [Pacmanvirus A23]|uniref:Hypothetical protein n=1 Tax=Pacmanvirus A23 TaxID=1932881 RepID=UPI000A092FAF|nr:Hypothetical protein B9W72_gp064 [Pacmanvirus A23]SIP85781.1 Hypothetical protein PACV_64 [Pacmanvirus A23]